MTMHITTRYEDLMDKQIGMLKLLYGRFHVYPTDTRVVDSKILEHAMEMTRRGETFPYGMWDSIKRINNDCLREILIFTANERVEAGWDEDELEAVKARDAEMARLRRSLKAWEAEARLNACGRN